MMLRPCQSSALIGSILPACLALMLLSAPAAPTVQAKDVKVSLEMLSPFRFDPPRFAVEPGDTVRMTLQNLDITDQPHNFVLTVPGNHQGLVNAALALAEKGPELDYVPPGDQVLAHAPLLKPGNKATLKFKAPEEPGIYPYVCTFPGHGMLMFGALYVGTEMPKLEDDPNISKMFLSAPPVEVTRPAFQRMFLPDAGPAAIAVALEGDQNYCWDAGACRLRYLWQGDFIDAKDYYASNGNALAEILGDVYWENPEGYPLTFGGMAPESVKFLGYDIVAGVPEFRYEIDGVLVREHITALTGSGKPGIQRRFQIENAPGPVHLPLDMIRPSDEIGVKMPGGAVKNGELILEPRLAQDFTLDIYRRK